MFFTNLYAIINSQLIPSASSSKVIKYKSSKVSEEKYASLMFYIQCAITYYATTTTTTTIASAIDAAVIFQTIVYFIYLFTHTHKQTPIYKH